MLIIGIIKKIYLHHMSSIDRLDSAILFFLACFSLVLTAVGGEIRPEGYLHISKIVPIFARYLL